jgi:hypothetical protein
LTTFKKHTQQDQLECFLASTTAALANQDDAITAHFASLSLSSPVSTTINRGPTFSGKSTEQKRVQESLNQLRDIETSLNDLRTIVDDKLSRIGNHVAADNIFLTNSMSTARKIQVKLSLINPPSPTIRQAKSSLLVPLGELVRRLEVAKRLWSEQAGVLPASADFTSEAIFKSGKLPFGIRTQL